MGISYATWICCSVWPIPRCSWSANRIPRAGNGWVSSARPGVRTSGRKWEFVPPYIWQLVHFTSANRLSKKKRILDAPEHSDQTALRTVPLCQSVTWRKKQGEHLTMQQTWKVESQLCVGMTTMLSTPHLIWLVYILFSQQDDGQDQRGAKSTLDSRTWSHITIEPWEEWTGWIRMLTCIEHPIDPKNGGRHFLHIA